MPLGISLRTNFFSPMKTVWPALWRGEEIDDLAFALVAPLRAQDDYISHFDQTYPVYRTLARGGRETEKRTPSSLEARRP